MLVVPCRRPRTALRKMLPPAQTIRAPVTISSDQRKPSFGIAYSQGIARIIQ